MEAKSRLRAELEKSSTPIRGTTFKEGIKNFQKGNKELSPVEAIKKKKKILVLIVEAIKAVGHPRKGASYQSIKKWIMNLEGYDTPIFKRMLKLALLKGLSEGELIRPSHCLKAIGITGSFKLPKKTQKKPEMKIAKLSKKHISSSNKKQTKEKTKMDAKAAGEKVSTKPMSAKVNGKKVSDKPAVAKTDQSETKIKKSKRVNEVKNLKESTKENAKKEKLEKNSKIIKTEVNAKNKRQPKKEASESGQSIVNKKETRKIDGKVKKVATVKKLLASKNVPNHKRKDFSDTELDTNTHRIKPLKSYSSDTELEISKRKNLSSKKNTKTGKRKVPGK